MRLREYLKQEKITQLAFAEKLGISITTLNLYINGRIKVPGVTMLAIQHLTKGKVKKKDWEKPSEESTHTQIPCEEDGLRRDILLQ